MKKALLFLVLAALIFFSCRKDHSASNQPKKKFPVTINISNFIAHGSHFAIRHGANHLADTISPGSYADVLYYLVYDAQGQFLISKQVQDSTMANMGMITDSLPNGTWPVIILVGKKGLTGSNNFQNLPSGDFGYGGFYWQDTFWAGTTVTVNNAPVTKSITANRVVGKLELNVLDAIPANASTISIAVYPEVAIHWLNTGKPEGGAPNDSTYTTATIPVSAIGHTNYTLDKIIGFAGSNFSVVVTCRDASKNVIARRTASNVTISTNERTILSGDLFTNTAPNSQNFTVKVDTAWGGSSTISF